ncbi:MAG: glutamine synthetase [Alphaproteobacteria bacterium]|nr:MAG: glutamine synthetase [Alphaproteobacteria bacterium]
MPGNMTFEELRAAVGRGEIDTVVGAIVDMQGRLMGKRFHAVNFVETAWEESHCCNYLLATDMEMFTVPGYRATSWAAGYGDYVMKPDLSTLRRVPWAEGTALVLCDVLDHHSHEEVPHSPRAVLRRQIGRLAERGWVAKMATELEFFLFRESFEELRDRGWRDPTPISAYNEDYHIFQTAKEEDVMRAIRNGLYGAGIPVENSKGEAEAGQEEINIRYSDPLDAADNHVIVKEGVKEIAWSRGRAATFLAKYDHRRAGSSSHIHQSLWSAAGEPLFFDPEAEWGLSTLGRQWIAGLLANAADITLFLAPYINSYKRFAEGTFAPTRIVWSRDNRTAGFRLCGEGTKAIRIECRIGGSDLNPYLAAAALIAAGLDGIDRGLELEPPFVGDAYHAGRARRIPPTLREAAARARRSPMLRQAFGEEVIEHYHHAAMWEQSEYDRVVTDWEVARGFERA